MAGVSRRRFLQWTGLATLSTSFQVACGRPAVDWPEARLVLGGRASAVERATARDAAALLGRAIGADGAIPVVGDDVAWQPGDLFVASPATSDRLTDAWRASSQQAGAFRLSAPASADAPGLVVAGVDPEGARNGLYRLLERVGFGFSRDGERLPELAGTALPRSRIDAEVEPAFRWRGEMIWDNYLGPTRYCAAAWGAADWERALIQMARTGLNFLEFYPPLAHVWGLAFPEVADQIEGGVWRADEKHALARSVLARARALGIHAMYVLSYGWFPEPVRRLYPDLEWAGGGFLCAHQPELQEMTHRVWTAMIHELGTDHLYAVRHRGEEGQSYSDPCRSITKAQGITQAYALLRDLDPDATVTVWTWAENVPELFGDLPADVRAAHIRYGMGGLFGDVGSGREQRDGRPDITAERHWLSGQFTLFSGSETLVRTAWSDAASLAADARVDAADATCEGFFQWPEWTATSPWLTDVIARLAWDPAGFEPVRALSRYALARHGEAANLFIRGFEPLLDAGNARVMVTPRKRVVMPFFLSADELALLASVREGLRGMWNDWPVPSTRQLDRDLCDLVTWIAVRQAHVFEAAAYVAARAGDRSAASQAISRALDTWDAARVLLAEVPELSIVTAARRMAAEAPRSSHAVDTFWVQACDFYRGYPLVIGPESIELVFAEQCRRLGTTLESALESGSAPDLPPPGFYWHDFPDPAWAEVVVGMPAEDAEAFETEMRARLEEAFRLGDETRREASLRTLSDRDPIEPLARPSVPSAITTGAFSRAILTLLGRPLPDPIEVEQARWE